MVGHNAIAAGFQGQRQWTDFYPNCDFAEAMLNTSFDWNGAREPYILATENDVLNGLGMLFMKLLTNRAQMFADVRTYWSARGGQARAPAMKSKAWPRMRRRIYPPDQFRRLLPRRHAARPGTQTGNAVMKPW